MSEECKHSFKYPSWYLPEGDLYNSCQTCGWHEERPRPQFITTTKEHEEFWINVLKDQGVTK